MRMASCSPAPGDTLMLIVVCLPGAAPHCAAGTLFGQWRREIQWNGRRPPHLAHGAVFSGEQQDLQRLYVELLLEYPPMPRADRRPVAGSHYWLMSLWSGTSQSEAESFPSWDTSTCYLRRVRSSSRVIAHNCHIVTSTCQHPGHSIETMNKEKARHLDNSLNRSTITSKLCSNTNEKL